MGTIFSIIAYCKTSSIFDEVAARAFKEIDRLNRMMSHYDPHSELSEINREVSHRRVGVSLELFDVLERALQLSRETRGAFDITIGPLMKAWGFFQGHGRVPSKYELDRIKKHIGWQHVHLDAATTSIAFDVPDIDLDLGAIGKGYAVDRVAEILNTAGITQALISSGTSSIYALGSAPDQDGWRISVCHPYDRRKTISSLWLQNRALSVSGDIEKAFWFEDGFYSHIMEPSRGRPASGVSLSLVISTSAAQSDALSTSFFVGGIEMARSYVECHSDLTAILYTPGTQGEVRTEELHSLA
jgi:thiamine biosynthesis lipoprotein